MGRKIYLGIIYFVAIVCVIFGCIIHVFDLAGDSFFGKLSGKLSGSGPQVEKSESLESFQKIDLDLSVMSVTIQTGSAYGLSYTCPEKLEPEYKITNGTLFVTQPDKISAGNNRNCDMTITIPDQVSLEKVISYIDVGTLSLNHIQTSELDATVDVGDIETDSCHMNHSTINIDVGNISLEDTSLGHCELEMSVGDTDAENCSFTSMNIKSDIGDVDLTDIPDLESFCIDLKTDIGEVSVNGEDHKRKYLSNEDAESKLIVRASTGDVDISAK